MRHPPRHQSELKKAVTEIYSATPCVTNMKNIARSKTGSFRTISTKR